jgi:hypothetical protein
MQKITSIINNQQGSVIIMAVIILALLTVIGISATNTSTTEVQVSTNAVLHNIAFYTADSGIEAGRAALNNLKSADSGSWDNLLFNLDAADEDKQIISWNGADCYTLNDTIDVEGGRRAGPAAFSLQVRDNDDLDGNPLIDTDNMVILTSSATYRNAQAQIQATVRYTGPADVYAQEHYDTANTGTALNESAEITGDLRW